VLVPNCSRKDYQPDSHNKHGEFEAAMNACQLSTSSSRVQPLALLPAAAMHVRTNAKSLVSS
jgi:hypothetical protein